MTTPIRLRSEAVDQLRRLTRLVSVELDRDVTQSDVLEQLAAFGLEHVGEIAGRLRAVPGDTPDGSPGTAARPGTQSD